LPKSTMKLRSLWFLVTLVVLLLLLPAVLPRFYTYILAVIFVTALLAMSLNMVVGHGGLFQFHHGVFYGMGAYAFALMVTKAGLPMWLCFIASPLVAAATGFLIGWFCVRLTSLYFGMLQISLGSLIWALAFRWYSLTSGDDGIHGVPVPDFVSSTTGGYYFILFFFVLGVMVMYMIHRSPFGTTMQAIRDNPARCSAIGIDVRRHALLGIVIAAFFAGVAGVLFVVLERSVFPDLLFWVLSLEIFIMCLLGGWYTFAGPILGAAITVSLRTFVGIYTEYWTLILGSLLILLIFFLPEGVMGFLAQKFGAGPDRQAEEGKIPHVTG
jgi:branched-chain amino acid transport system permease protein